MKQLKLISFLLVLLVTINNCTDLEEKYGGNLKNQQVSSANANALLNNLDNSMRTAFQGLSDVIPLSEMTTDEMIGPTRGLDWSDNGIWRSLHLQTWGPDHLLISVCFNDLNGVIFAATDFLKFSPSPQQEARARFYRAWAMYWLFDFFDQVPYRDPGESTLLPARVRSGMDALNYIISEINAVMENLSIDSPTSPTKNAAKVLLMKCYLNKTVYANRQSFSSFDISDMNKVISLADEVINSNQYAFSNNYFDNFAPDNANLGKENIFTQENIGGAQSNSELPLIMMASLHYNSKNTPFGGFNGWTTLSDTYDKFENGDKRKGQVYQTEGSFPNPGNRINMGLLIDQQYDLITDEPLMDGTKKFPLIFTREVRILENGDNLEVTGIRPQKYAWDFQHYFALDNDWVYLRLPDVLLMKAEAILRGGTATGGPYGNTALQLVNAIRQHPSRGASALASLDLKSLLDERSRELWLECWRRQDMIRFKTFLEPFQEKNYTSESKYLLFPIPNQQIALNPHLKQNQGY